MTHRETLTVPAGYVVGNIAGHRLADRKAGFWRLSISSVRVRSLQCSHPVN